MTAFYTPPIVINSIYKAIEYMYSGKFKPWEKCSVPRNYWKNDDNIRNALKWLFEEKLDIFKDGTIITTKDFKDNNLYGLLHNHFNGSTYGEVAMKRIGLADLPSLLYYAAYFGLTTIIYLFILGGFYGILSKTKS